jgi:glycosyltransferase involved in cell wall biosynthesis
MTPNELFSFAYGVCGRCATSIMTNSSWTKNHLDTLWGVDTKKVFPPCDVSNFQKLELTKKRVKGQIMSLAQFRPEKNHILQIEAFINLKKKCQIPGLKLIMAGGVRKSGYILQNQIFLKHYILSIFLNNNCHFEIFILKSIHCRVSLLISKGIRIYEQNDKNSAIFGHFENQVPIYGQNDTVINV